MDLFVLLDSPNLVSFPASIDRETTWATSLNHLFLRHTASAIYATHCGGTSKHSVVGPAEYSRRHTNPSHKPRPTDGL